MLQLFEAELIPEKFVVDENITQNKYIVIGNI